MCIITCEQDKFQFRVSCSQQKYLELYILKIYDDILCVIPARGGSKGIPGKNKKLLAGIPLVSHSIQHAILAGIPKENIVISSDDEEILDIAIDLEVCIVKRPSDISGDKSSTEMALLHTLIQHGRYYRDKSKHVCLILTLQPTSPIRFRGTIERFIQNVKDYFPDRLTSALSGTEVHPFFWEAMGMHFIPNYNPKDRPMRQYLNRTYLENGSMYITSVEALLRSQCRLSGEIGVFPISYVEGLQIDTQEEFDLVERLFQGEILSECLNLVKS